MSNYLVWLIERDSPAFRALWIRLADGHQTWTNDANTALQFSRREDALEYLKTHGSGTEVGKITEHLFIDAALKDKP